ncbi:hypothetical protein [Pontiella sulfatireligans]|uniref:PEP-CTERM protein-sorting domain-containing protein n=1 Tax=Pontiella sulfatireligans TaxID=2750658 RepID=A0A6C2UPF8_9BACT|nr:hypothetical protein [Pontiella sulfatireligans]VGO22088.1 hypothetical protein SCARR_04169 [Pontiella sulfatireligans]
MKRNISMALAVLALCGGAQAELLIGWDGGLTGSSAKNVEGITGNLWGGSLYTVNTSAGSEDGTFGPTETGASTDLTAYEIRTVVPGSTDTLGIQIINGTGQDLTLDKLVFDYANYWGGAPSTLTISYAYGALTGIANGTVIKTFSDIGTNGGLKGDYTDYEVSLAGLADFVLADGEKATFNLVGSDANAGSISGAFDNLGFTGTVVPEPQTLSLLTVMASGLFGLRRIFIL